MKYDKIVCYDLEMCCWEDKPCGEIIEFSLVEVDLYNEIITRSNQYLVTPDNDEISQFCYQLTGHTNKKVKKQGRKLPDVLQTIQKKYSIHKPFVAWGRDDETLRRECLAKNIKFELTNPLNLGLVFNTFFLAEKKYSQDDVLELFGLEPEGTSHVAINDAYNLAKILIEMKKRFMI